ncbi:MAG TPA: type II toxin-antitoxin system RelE/ParE family toxin [Prolixibacteraceae bacterium]|nr:type II toxin-antitoxin system RelE/ParE family toxin [Prolixibacteraceae bacterium]
MHKLIIKAFAELDAIDAANWYNEKGEGLGEEFVLALDAKINAIQRNPTHFQVVYKNIRRALTERFPYGIFFIVEDEIIYVLAIQHTSINPKIWKKRK